MARANQSNARANTAPKVKVAPAVLTFDGSTVAGGVHQLGADEDVELIGSSIKLDVNKMLEISRVEDEDGWSDSGDDDDENDDENDGGAPHDSEAALSWCDRIAGKLYRSCDAYIIQSLCTPVNILVANIFNTSLSSTKELSGKEGHHVQARYQGSRLWYGATLESLNDDG